jgi:hypothetical protein
MPGRPTKLNEDVLVQTQQYIDECEDDQEKKKVNLPSIEGLALYLKVNKDSIYEWRKGTDAIHLHFSELIAQLLSKQAQRLLNNGLAGTYNSTIAKVLLTKHGYREGIEQTGKDGEPLTIALEQKQAIEKALDDV